MAERPAGAGSAADAEIRSADELWMVRAMAAADAVRGRTAPNPWVGAVVVQAARDLGPDTSSGSPTSCIGVGATAPVGGPHAEVAALNAAGGQAVGGTLYVTLEPCAHHGRTPPCTDGIVAAGVARVVVGIEDPDPRVSGRGIAALREAGIEVELGVAAPSVADQLAPYLHHRRTGRPWVVLKLAASLDGRIAAPDGSSRWITGEAARRDAHRLRARSDAVLVGAGTVRADDPALTVRLPEDDPDHRSERDQPLRVVLGHVPPDAAVHPALELTGDPHYVLSELGGRGVLQVLVEGGARVAHAFHAAGLVNRYVLYLAPALFGGNDALPIFAGSGIPTIDHLWRGAIRSTTNVGGDLRVELSPPEQERRGANVLFDGR
ncbi:MAG: bifunctional diaminohydroxyphosphoribosylaminopyrimidine deaminase/5-amino-6-(5-phosphoribosylamino)uracil reductase RibD [Acidimicrobiales bacterium]